MCARDEKRGDHDDAERSLPLSVIAGCRLYALGWAERVSFSFFLRIKLAAAIATANVQLLLVFGAKHFALSSNSSHITGL